MIKTAMAPYRPLVGQVAPLCLAVTGYAVAFGALGTAVGLSWPAVVAISLLVYTGGAQMAFVGVLSGGGAPLAGAASGLLVNSRLVAFGAVAAPLMQGPPLRRLATAYLLTDEVATVATAQPDPDARRRAFWATALPLWTCWQLATLAGALAGSALVEPRAVGLDAAFPAAFLVLLMPLVRGRRELGAAAGGAVGALVGLQTLPSGGPMVLAIACGLLGALAVGNPRTDADTRSDADDDDSRCGQA